MTANSHISNVKIGVIGLGYVGLPVAIAFARKFDVVGFDIDKRRVSLLKEGSDWTGEIESEELAASTIKFTSEVDELKGCNFFVVSVPTPVDGNNNPDFSLLRSACQLIAPAVDKGSVVVFESTVYPGATEEICGPELEKATGLECGVDFKLGYSPERINPGDKQHPLEKIVKIVSGQDAETLDLVADVYGEIIEAGICRASSIKVAEAAKVLENTQRDINIALMNEMSKICDKVGIRTIEVLQAAGTKWNFLNFTPGLVGGHCIGVDPYYLTSKAEQLGFHPEIILAGRRINDGMPAHVAARIVQLLAKADLPIRRARIGILGMTFKENVPDIRNSKVVELYTELCHFGMEPLVADPVADPDQTKHEYNIDLSNDAAWENLDCLILAVPHAELAANINERINTLVANGGVVVDLKNMLNPAELRSDINYWSL